MPIEMQKGSERATVDALPVQVASVGPNVLTVTELAYDGTITGAGQILAA